MYSELQKIDIVVPETAGSDHRPAEEVATALEVVFALTRILAPKRSKEGAGATVRYVCMDSMHPALAEVIASTGAHAEAQGKTVALEGVPRRAPADIADEAFSALGKRLLAKHKLAADEAGLATYEASLADEREDAEGDETGYWTAVVELAAVTGEVLREKYAGRWVDDPRDYSDIPFMFRPALEECGFINPVGKAVKFL